MAEKVCAKEVLRKSSANPVLFPRLKLSPIDILAQTQKNLNWRML